jgi:hypothetical protein
MPLTALFIVRGLLVLFDTAPSPIGRAPARSASGQERARPGPAETILLGLYLRIIVMQFTIILGAMVALLLGTAGALALLIVIKTAVDVSFQLLADRFHDAWLKAKAQARTSS